MSYQELLNTKEWNNKRSEIIERDNKCCTVCGRTDSNFLRNFPDIHLCFNKNVEIVHESISDSKLTIEEHKIRNNIKTITIIATKECLVGISSEEKNIYLIDPDVNITSINVEFLMIKKAKLSNNSDIYIITTENKNLDLSNILIPQISDFQLILNVHHKYYITGRKPWEYDNNVLVTLCNECHSKIHIVSHVPYFDENFKDRNLMPCKRCFGTGYFPEYKHIEKGICFRCNGNRFEELIEK